MYNGDRSRKETLVEYGFRLPSALDNRPLKFEEWEQRVGQVIYVSATPGDYELKKSEGVVVEQVIRPTGLLDPEIEVRPVKDQVDDLLGEIRERVKDGERVLVTTLTKRMAEDLTEYYTRARRRVRYLHSDIDTLERIEIIRDLRRGEFDVLVGINLLREGLDLPEVSLVAILDADKEGFLRSDRSLIQTCGRAARNVNGTVIMYGDRDHRGDEARHRRDRAAAHDPGGVQQEAQDHAEDGAARDPRHARQPARRDYVDVDKLPARMAQGGRRQGEVRRRRQDRGHPEDGRRACASRCTRRPRISTSRRRPSCAIASRRSRRSSSPSDDRDERARTRHTSTATPTTRRSG